MTVRIHFTRYRNGERRISTAVHGHADDIFGGLNKAQSMLEGLRQADPEGQYDIVSVEMAGFVGIRCGGSRWFETNEELAARAEPAVRTYALDEARSRVRLDQ